MVVNVRWMDVDDVQKNELDLTQRPPKLVSMYGGKYGPVEYNAMIQYTET